MEIKSLLYNIFSALFLVFFTATASAAPKDAPELIKKETQNSAVQMCPTYGEGYFYVPGTNTCMKLAGYIFSDFSGGNNIEADNLEDFSAESRSIGWKTRGALSLSSASKTDFGTLRTFMELRHTWQSGGYFIGQDTPLAEMHFAYVELGGLRFGLDESAFAHWTGYYGGVLSDDLLTPVSTSTTHVLSYVYNNDNGFSIMAAAEQGNYGNDIRNVYPYLNADGTLVYPENATDTPVAPIFNPDSYIPNIVLGAKYMQGWGGFSSVIAYDAYFKNFAAKARADINFNDLTLWGMVGYKAADDYFNYKITESSSNKKAHIYKVFPSIYGDWFGHYMGWVGATYKLAETANVNGQFSMDSEKDFAIAASLNYDITPNFVVTPEIAYRHHADIHFAKPTTGTESIYDLANKNAFKVTLRLTRSF